jgi:hypothetical protein
MYPGCCRIFRICDVTMNPPLPAEGVDDISELNVEVLIVMGRMSKVTENIERKIFTCNTGPGLAVPETDRKLFIENSKHSGV